MKILFGHRFGKERLADAKEISRLYELYKSPFISFALKYYPVKEETAEDIYQESFTIMFRNVRDGKYRDRQASLKTYLFEIGKHRICTHLAKNKLEFVPIQTLVVRMGGGKLQYGRMDGSTEYREPNDRGSGRYLQPDTETFLLGTAENGRNSQAVELQIGTGREKQEKFLLAPFHF